MTGTSKLIRKAYEGKLVRKGKKNLVFELPSGIRVTIKRKR